MTNTNSLNDYIHALEGCIVAANKADSDQAND